MNLCKFSCYVNSTKHDKVRHKMRQRENIFFDKSCTRYNEEDDSRMSLEKKKRVKDHL